MLPLASSAIIVCRNGDPALIASPSSHEDLARQADPRQVVAQRDHLHLDRQRLAEPGGHVGRLERLHLVEELRGRLRPRPHLRDHLPSPRPRRRPSPGPAAARPSRVDTRSGPSAAGSSLSNVRSTSAASRVPIRAASPCPFCGAALLTLMWLMSPAAADGEHRHQVVALDRRERLRQRVRVVGRVVHPADRVEVHGEVDVAGDRGLPSAVSTNTTGTAGSVGPAGRTIFGFFFPGFQPTVPSVMWNRRLNASPSSGRRRGARRAGLRAASAFSTASAIFAGQVPHVLGGELGVAAERVGPRLAVGQHRAGVRVGGGDHHVPAGDAGLLLDRACGLCSTMPGVVEIRSSATRAARVPSFSKTRALANSGSWVPSAPRAE